MDTLQALYDWLRPLWVVWMMGLFLAIVAWVLWPRRKADMERHARIPFEGDEEKG